ncbi:GNAT family N-acetyltransferase [Asanoa sp. NPDC050611]|uniref:GNAT family N-acetyltransferase n=1 Tax=Asanoa sp. NPDC050611 TaxID=3157098 RepID=UPI0033F456A2
MSEPMIKIVAEPGALRWQALARGDVAGVLSLRPVIALGPDPPPAVGPGGLDLSLYVEPMWRHRGIGSTLLAAARVRTAAGPRLLADVIAGSPGEAFCRRHGFRRAGARHHDLLTYCDVHRAWLGELVDAEHPGYRLTHWTGDLPAAGRLDELVRRPSTAGNAVLTAAEAGGELVAYAIAVVGPRARQYGPTVLPNHRGRRLGRWVNAALIQRLREVHPHVAEIETVTADDDRHRIAVHRHLGFRPVRRTHLYEL